MAEDVESRENIEREASKKASNKYCNRIYQTWKLQADICYFGAAGGHSPYDFRIGFYNDTPKMFGDALSHGLLQRRRGTEVNTFSSCCAWAFPAGLPNI